MISINGWRIFHGAAKKDINRGLPPKKLKQ